MLLTYLRDYRYHNAPDGKHPLEKVIATSKYGFTGGLIAGLYECVTNQHVNSISRRLNCMAFWTLPPTAMCATFSTVVYMATDLRQLETPTNYIFGAFGAAAVHYQWQKNGPQSFMLGVIGAIVGVIYAYNRKVDKHAFTTLSALPPHSFYLIRGDYSLLKDPRPWKN